LGSSIKLLYGAYAHFLVSLHRRTAGLRKLADRCGESEPPAVKHRLRHTRSLLVAVEDQVHLLARRVTPRMYAIEARTRSCVQAVSSITHVTAGWRDLPRRQEFGDRAR
jgi:hypothetical protein